MAQIGNEPTVRFIRTMDHLFDILKSQSPCGTGPKGPLRKENIHYWKPKLLHFHDYLESMKTTDGVPLLEHRRKTAFSGLIITVNSVLNLATELLLREVMSFKYFLTYKLSQDHLELFFSKIRSRGGFNNNPSVMQFKAAFRSLILKNCIAPSMNANCLPLESDDGYITISRKRQPYVPDTEHDDIILETYVDTVSQSKFVDSCLYYIAGFVSRTVAASLSCDDCIAAMFECILDVPRQDTCGFVHRKDRGGLKYVSHSVYKIISITENILNKEIICARKLPSNQNLRLVIQYKVLDQLHNYSLFPLFDAHFSESVFVTGDSHY